MVGEVYGWRRIKYGIGLHLEAFPEAVQSHLQTHAEFLRGRRGFESERQVPVELLVLRSSVLYCP